MNRITDSLLYFANDSWGEDRLFFGENFCGTIDGATTIDRIPVSGYTSQSEWLSEKMRSYLEGRVTISDFPCVCNDFIVSIKDSDVISRIASRALFDIPSATIAAVVESEEALTGYVLGDCGILFRETDDTLHYLTDQRINAFSKRTVKAKNRAESLSEDAEKAVRAQMIKNRRMLNTKNGFWAVAPIGSFAEEFRVFEIPLKKINRFIVFTDGLTQICDMCGLALETLIALEKPSLEIEKCIENVKSGKTAVSSSYAKRIDDIGFIVVDPG